MEATIETIIATSAPIPSSRTEARKHEDILVAAGAEQALADVYRDACQRFISTSEDVVRVSQRMAAEMARLEAAVTEGLHTDVGNLGDRAAQIAVLVAQRAQAAETVVALRYALRRSLNVTEV